MGADVLPRRQHVEQLRRARIRGRAAGGVHQDVTATARGEYLLEVVCRSNHMEGGAQHVRVDPQLFHRSHPESVGRDQSEGPATSGTFLGGDLRDRGGLASTGRSHEHLDWRVVGVTRDEVSQPRRQRGEFRMTPVR